MPYRITNVTLVALLLCLGALSVKAQAPASLELIDLTAGTSTAGGTQGSLVPGHSVMLRVNGAPNTPHLLALSTSPTPPNVLPFQGVPLGIDVTSFLILWDGFTNPAVPPLSPSGQLDVPLVVPDPAPLGSNVFLQALTGGLGPGALLITNHLELTFSGEPMTTVQQATFSQHPLAQTSAGGVLAINTQAGWTAFWNQHYPLNPAIPAVDFTTSFLVVAFEGIRYASQPAFRIDAVYLDLLGVLQVHTTETIPGVIGRPVVTTASHIVSVPLGAYSATLNETRTIVALP